MNDAPVAVADTGFGTNEDTPFEITLADLLLNDSDADNGDSFQVVEVSGVGPVGDAQTVSFDPRGLFDNLAEGETEIFQLGYTIEDSFGARDTAAINIEIAGRNDAPMVLNNLEGFGLTKDGLFSFNLALLTQNFSDPDGTVLEVVGIDQSETKGLVRYEGFDEGVEIVGPGSGKVIPGENDGSNLALELAEREALERAEKETLRLDLGAELEVEGSPTFPIEVAPETGFVPLLGTGPDQKLIYDPNGQFAALRQGESVTDSFLYKVRDEAGAEVTAEITLTIEGINTAPMAMDDTAFTRVYQPVILNILANDSDPEGDIPVIFYVDTSGAKGVVTDLGNGDFSYDPNGAYAWLAPGETATESFSYTITDGNFGFDSGLVTVTIGGEEFPVGTGDAFEIRLPGKGATFAGFDGDDFYLRGSKVGGRPKYDDVDDLLARVVQHYKGDIEDAGVIDDPRLPAEGIGYGQPDATSFEIAGGAAVDAYMITFDDAQATTHFAEFSNELFTAITDNNVVATDPTDFQLDVEEFRFFFDDQNNQFGVVDMDGMQQRFDDLETFIEGAIDALGGTQLRDGTFNAVRIAYGAVPNRIRLDRDEDLVISGRSVGGRFEFELPDGLDPNTVVDDFEQLFDLIAKSGAIGANDMLLV